MHPVTFKTGQVEAIPEGQTRVTVFTYADNRNYALYLDVPLEEAKRRFTERMNNRHSFEVEREGWDAVISVCGITDELWIAGSFGQDLQDFTQQLMQQMTGGNDKNR